MRPTVAALVLLGLTTLTAAQAADEGFTVTPVTPAAQSFHIGKMKLTTLHDAQIVVPNDGKSFGTDAKAGEVADVLQASGEATGEITLSVNVLMVKTGSHTVLLDVGVGPEWHGALLDSLKLAGVSPRSVTDILITHTHGDHVNGLLDAQGKLAFPRATIRMSEDEWEWMKTKGSEQLVNAISGHVISFRAGETVAPGIRSLAIEGHTPGHVGYDIEAGVVRLRDIGDLAHSWSISLARPQWLNGFDHEEAAARTSRLRMLAEVARSHELIYAPHFPYPGIGYILPDGAAYKWQSASP